MKKQMLAVMVGLSVVLGGCSSSQSTESMLQEVKKEAKEVKSGKVELETSINSDKMEESNSSGFNLVGDTKFDPTELALKGNFKVLGMNLEMEHYMKDGVYYTKTMYGNKPSWHKKEAPKDDANGISFKTVSLNMDESVLNYLDNKDNWETKEDGDKVIFTLKKTDDIKNKLQEVYKTKVKKEAAKIADFDYKVEYIYNRKAKKVDAMVFEVDTKQDDLDIRTVMKGKLEELNKEVKIEVPEESKNALEMKIANDDK